MIQYVVAKYKENIDWTKNLDNVIIYDKNNSTLPNVGRESHTYIHHIITNWENLADITVFLQGHPHDHTNKMNLDNFLKKCIEEAKVSNCSQNFTINKQWADSGSSYENLLKLNRIVDNYDLNLNDFFYKYIGKEYNNDIKWYIGAQFAVTKETIHKISKEKWQELLISLEYSINPITGHYMERMWYELFTLT